MQINENLKLIRNQKHETQKEIAEVLNTTQQQYWKYEKGLQEIPARHIITLAEHYKISANEILGIKKETYTITISEEEKNLIDQYRKLKSNYKGKIEERIETLIEIQDIGA